MIYHYRICQGIATLSKMNDDGSDVDQKPVKIGAFKSQAQAKEACVKHHGKACAMARSASRDEPSMYFL